MGRLILFIVLLTIWLPTHLPRCFPTSRWSILHSHLAYNWLEGGVLEYSMLIKLMAEHTAKVVFPYVVYKYVLPIHLWTWCYITIANSQVFHLQLLSTHWLTHAYLLTIIIVIHLVHSLFLALTIARVACTIIDLHIYFVYLLQNLYCILLSHLHTLPPLAFSSSLLSWPVVYIYDRYSSHTNWLVFQVLLLISGQDFTWLPPCPCTEQLDEWLDSFCM